MKEAIVEVPALGIESVRNQAERVSFPEGTFPWLDGQVEAKVADVTLETGEAIRFGSVVGEHNKLEKLASVVPADESHKAEIGLFKALPELLGTDHSSWPANIEVVPNTDHLPYNVLKVVRHGSNPARLYFTILEEDGKPPLVLKLGIAQQQKHLNVQKIITGRNPGK